MLSWDTRKHSPRIDTTEHASGGRGSSSIRVHSRQFVGKRLSLLRVLRVSAVNRTSLADREQLALGCDVQHAVGGDGGGVEAAAEVELADQLVLPGRGQHGHLA